MIYPIHFEPIYQNYVWGGTKILQKFHRKSELQRIAESWELADRKEAVSVVCNGEYKGKTLHDLVHMLKEQLLGQEQRWDRFPLLLKIIDAKENLSVQVHPNEENALKLQGEPKTEMWFALENSSVYAGLKSGIDECSFMKSIESNTVEKTLRKWELKKGDALYIPGGCPHAICKGSFLYEVQQNSNTTYRLYDWGRTERELHITKGLAAIHWKDQTSPKIIPQLLQKDPHHQLTRLISSPFFIVDKLDVLDTFYTSGALKTFQIYFCIEGKGEIATGKRLEPFLPGMTYLIPASAPSIEIYGKCEALRITMNSFALAPTHSIH